MSLPAHLQAQISAETVFLRVPGDFVLENGERLVDVEIAFRTWGDPANAGNGAILICHALTGSADVDAWWPDIIGSGKAFDPAHDYIVTALTSRAFRCATWWNCNAYCSTNWALNG
jgi:homoserine acetyltransferase